MGFTIGGLRDFRELRLGPRLVGRVRRQAAGAISAPGSTAVAEYSGLWGWEVVPGAHAVIQNDRASCSCGHVSCPTPGAHPLDPSVRIAAGTPLEEVADTWAMFPGATMLLPVGVHFDVLDVPEAAGRRALVRLERMGLPMGPVALAPHGRVWFFVERGVSLALPTLLYRMGWDDTGLDLRCPRPGAYVTAPPSDFGGLGPVRWLRPPALEAAGRLPHARLLLGTLAYVCHRSTSTGRAPRG